jgi:hypothetical protein
MPADEQPDRERPRLPLPSPSGAVFSVAQPGTFQKSAARESFAAPLTSEDTSKSQQSSVIERQNPKHE